MGMEEECEVAGEGVHGKGKAGSEVMHFSLGQPGGRKLSHGSLAREGVRVTAMTVLGSRQEGKTDWTKKDTEVWVVMEKGVCTQGVFGQLEQ